MVKNHAKRRDLMREQLAYHAAKLIAEDGISDFAFAKRKAARQLGAADTRHMPSNQEIEDALRSYRKLYQDDHHPDVLRRLREEALAAMHTLEPFQPYLTGSVLRGTAGEQSDINFVLFSDDAKAVLLFLLKHKTEFDESEWKLKGGALTVPSYTLAGQFGTPIHLVVLPENMRFSGMLHGEALADITAVEALSAG